MAKMTNEERKQLTRERQNAVRHAWKEEQERVRNGKGSRDWTLAEQKELLEKGSVKGYEGHHMKSVTSFPEHAGNSKNIQFLNEDEHLNGAHKGNFHNKTNGYYDPQSKTMSNFKDDELVEVPVNDLTQKYSDEKSDSLNDAKDNYISNTEESASADKSSGKYSSAIDEAKSDHVNSMEGKNEAENEAETESETESETEGEDDGEDNGEGEGGGMEE